MPRKPEPTFTHRGNKITLDGVPFTLVRGTRPAAVGIAGIARDGTSTTLRFTSRAKALAFYRAVFERGEFMDPPMSTIFRGDETASIAEQIARG